MLSTFFVQVFMNHVTEKEAIKEIQNNKYTDKNSEKLWSNINNNILLQNIIPKNSNNPSDKPKTSTRLLKKSQIRIKYLKIFLIITKFIIFFNLLSVFIMYY